MESYIMLVKIWLSSKGQKIKRTKDRKCSWGSGKKRKLYWTFGFVGWDMNYENYYEISKEVLKKL